jgi:glutathione S-transferase
MIALQKAADVVADVWRILDRQLATRRHVEGDTFTLADVALGAYARRWFGVEGIAKPDLPHLARWFATLQDRPGFIRYIAPPLS